MKYKIKYYETYEKYYDVEGDSYEDAKQKLEENIREDHIDGPTNCVDSGFFDATDYSEKEEIIPVEIISYIGNYFNICYLYNNGRKIDIFVMLNSDKHFTFAAKMVIENEVDALINGYINNKNYLVTELEESILDKLEELSQYSGFECLNSGFKVVINGGVV